MPRSISLLHTPGLIGATATAFTRSCGLWVRGVDFQDYSISRAHPLNTDTDPELGRELCGIIYRMDALLIMAGMYANNSPWMQFEINAAFAYGVPIIPILANGQMRVPRLPTRLATIPPVRWRGDSIREALLRCVPADRREAIEAQAFHRIAAAKEAERQLRAVEAARRAQAYGSGNFQSQPLLKLTPPQNAMIDYLGSRPTTLSDLLKRR
jgi:hypothetical protein